MNTFGTIYRFTSFGESHGTAIGGVIDGMPSGVRIDLDEVQRQLDRRRPGQSAITTSRREADKVEILSGLMDGVTTGTPIGFVIRNDGHRSDDYDQFTDAYRPSHADYSYTAKYGLRDHRGGGRASARETASRVVAGAFARQALALMGITVEAYTSQIGEICVDKDYGNLDLSLTETNMVRCPDPEKAEAMSRLILNVKNAGDTVGGVATCIVRGVPAGVGDPIASRLDATLAAAMMSINAVKGFEYGMGFAGASMRGSETLDLFVPGSDEHVRTQTNRSGGIQGGISNGQDIYMRVAFKPIATLLRDIESIDAHGNPVIIKAKGRHDPCAVPRAIPVVEAMAAMTILDAVLLNRCARI
ncbi:MAG: chorismate synthase [Muribaculaceae bacterium]|nr:chorismate synthase [Muribaculaceae bacterium]